MTQFFKVKQLDIPRGELPPVNILPQQRKNTGDLSELRDCIIANGGLINPINIIYFDSRKKAVAYQSFFQKMYGDNKRTNLVPNEDGIYYFLVAGHRRFAALDKTSSKDVPRVSIGLLIPNDEMSTMEEISLQAAFYQARENMYSAPNPTDRAHSIVAMRNAMRAARKGQKVTVIEVARESGQSESSVSDALRFYGLPEYLRKMTITGEISYGRALIIGRLFYASFKGKKTVSRAEIDFMLRSTIAQKTPELLLLARVNEIINRKRDELLGQDLFSTGFSLPDIIDVESRSAATNQAKLWMSLNAQATAFIVAVRKDPVLLESELGGIFGDPLKTLVMSNANLLEELTRLLRAKRLLGEIPSARVRKAAGGVRIAVVAAKS